MENHSHMLRLCQPTEWVGKVQPAIVFDGNDETLHKHLIETANALGEKMLDFGGYALAAPHCGLGGRMFVLRGHPDLIVCINPKIVNQEGETLAPENCPSHPGLIMRIKRASEIRVRYQTVTGETITSTMNGLTARAFQQMLDVIDGVPFYKHASKFARDRAMTKWNKLRKQFSHFNVPKGKYHA